MKHFYFNTDVFLEKKKNESALQKLLQKQTQKQSQTNAPDEEQSSKGMRAVAYIFTLMVNDYSKDEINYFKIF